MRPLAILHHPRLPWLAAGLAMVLCLPALGSGFFSDDWIHRAMLLGAGPFPASAHPVADMFAFLGARAPFSDPWAALGLTPWWADPGISITLWRPVTALTHLLDARAWPDSALLPHLQSLAWLGLAVGLAALLFRRVEAGAAAGLAALLFAVEDAHAVPVAWIANRNALICLVFGIGTLLAHQRWRGTRRWRDLGLALGAFGLALFSGEAALGALAYLLAWQLFLDCGPWRRRLVALLPYLGLMVAWRALYQGLGYGITGSGLYIDPLHAPVAFCRAVAERGPLLMAGQWLQAPLDVWVMMPRRSQLLATGAGALASAGIMGLAAPVMLRSPTARFWALGMVLSLAPLCATFPMDRLLIFAGLGAAGLLAAMVREAGWLGEAARLRVGRARRLALVILLLIHGPLAAPTLALKAGTALRWLAPVDRMAEQIGALPAVGERTLVMVNGHDLLQVGLAFTVSGQGRSLPRRFLQLGAITTPLDVTRIDARTLELRQVGGLLGMAFDRLHRSPDRPFAVGERFSMPDADMEVLEVSPDGLPLRWRARFQVPLEDPSLCFTRLQMGGLEPWTPPPVGATERLTIALHALTAPEALRAP